MNVILAPTPPPAAPRLFRATCSCGGFAALHRTEAGLAALVDLHANLPGVHIIRRGESR